MRVKVALPISKPIRRGGFLAGSDGQRTWFTLNTNDFHCFAIGVGLWGTTPSIVRTILHGQKLTAKWSASMESG